MRKFFGPMGSVSRVTVESRALKSNMLGDPSERAVDVYIPAQHDGRDLPLLVDLGGFTGSDPLFCFRKELFNSTNLQIQPIYTTSIITTVSNFQVIRVSHSIQFRPI